jgi:serine/threonine protein kinase
VEATPFGRYRLIELVGRGGMGEVWRAFDTVTQRVVAIKVLPPQMAQDPTFEARFRREAKAAAGLDNPHIVPIYDYGEIDGRLFVTMRLVKGRDLATVIAQGPLPPEQAVAIVDQIAGALHAAHRAELIHRDVKPSNILLDEDGYAYLIDFGIAQAASQTKLTSTGMTIGTWAYMAPERFTTGQTDSRADIYALACVLHETLTGAAPFPGHSLEQLMYAHVHTPPPPPSTLRAGVPTAMDTVIATGMAKNPDDRYANTREMADAAKSAVTAPVTWPAPGPAQHRIFTDPTQRGPARSDPNPPAPKSSRNRVIALSSVAAVVAILAVAAAIGLSNSGDRSATPIVSPTITTPTTVPNTGPFTGTFTATFGPPAMGNGAPADGVPFTDTFSLRSACSTNGCVATASSTGQYASKDVVFDEVGEQWLAVSTSRRKCSDVEDAEAFNVISLRPQLDGTFTGEMTQVTTNGCQNKRTVAFSRTGDTDMSTLPNPAELPPRVVSAAEALHGLYKSVIKYASSPVPTELDYGVRTDCLRTGDRCFSAFAAPKDGTGGALVFANGAWTRNALYNGECSGGEPTHVKNTASFPIPEPPQSPITLLSGHGFSESTGCPSTAYVQTLTRTGE